MSTGLVIASSLLVILIPFIIFIPFFIFMIVLRELLSATAAAASSKARKEVEGFASTIAIVVIKGFLGDVGIVVRLSLRRCSIVASSHRLALRVRRVEVSNRKRWSGRLERGLRAQLLDRRLILPLMAQEIVLDIVMFTRVFLVR